MIDVTIFLFEEKKIFRGTAFFWKKGSCGCLQIHTFYIKFKVSVNNNIAKDQDNLTTNLADAPCFYQSKCSRFIAYAHHTLRMPDKTTIVVWNFPGVGTFLRVPIDTCTAEVEFRRVIGIWKYRVQKSVTFYREIVSFSTATLLRFHPNLMEMLSWGISVCEILCPYTMVARDEFLTKLISPCLQKNKENCNACRLSPSS